MFLYFVSLLGINNIKQLVKKYREVLLSWHNFSPFFFYTQFCLFVCFFKHHYSLLLKKKSMQYIYPSILNINMSVWLYWRWCQNTLFWYKMDVIIWDSNVLGWKWQNWSQTRVEMSLGHNVQEWKWVNRDYSRSSFPWNNISPLWKNYERISI